MSQLQIYDKNSKSFKLNVTQFRSPMSATINSAQTKTMMQHFPIRCGQPDIQFTVQYASMDDKHAFEAFVRSHQLAAQADGNKGLLKLWWPERNMENWSGYICQYQVIEARFQTAPAATFGVSLVDSMMSVQTTIATRGISLNTILGIQIPTYQGYADTILVRPTPPSNNPPVNSDPTPPTPITPGSSR
jgi:hypothetical protein